ncbi:hypothetical protein ACFL5Z_20200 [Planctomycetota bacterium]
MREDGFDQPLYVSRRMFRNLWQEYRIYTDRIELRSCVGRKVIRAEDIIDVEVRPPLVIGDLFRCKGFARSFALKLDLADFFRHVAIHRRSGWIKHIRITPDDPDMFVSLCKSIMPKGQ